MKEVTIFYSWQSDHKETNRFISKALTKAVEELKKGEVEKPIILDRDTQGVMGSPHIVSTILGKIDVSDIVVVDVTIVGELNEDKKVVNQNVMYELGYSIAKHTEGNIIMLFNEDQGKHKDLPFDISHLRKHTFSIKKDPEGKQLVKSLVGLLKKYIDSLSVQETQKVEQQLPVTQLLIMKAFAGMPDEKRIMAVKTLGGYVLIPAGKVDESSWGKLNELDMQETVAELNDLAYKNILTINYGNKGTPNYEPTSEGFRIIKAIKTS